MVLGILWLVLLILDFTRGLSPFLNALMMFIWVVFVVDFALRFILAPRKLGFLRSNWLTALSLFIPALRIGRIARVAQAFRALRSARLVSLVSSVNRGMRILRATLRRNAFGYVSLLTLVILLLGAAGVYAFEGPPGQGGIRSYGESLWWTAMIMTSFGSDYWPTSAEGRLLTVLLALYSLAMFGYITATLATFFLGRPHMKDSQDSSLLLLAELRALREEVAELKGSQK
jgi:voltage-gated potassium channel